MGEQGPEGGWASWDQRWVGKLGPEGGRAEKRGGWVSQDEGRDKGEQQSQLHVPSGQIWQPEFERLGEILTVTTLRTDITTAVLQYQYMLVSHSPLYNFTMIIVV